MVEHIGKIAAPQIVGDVGMTNWKALDGINFDGTESIIRVAIYSDLQISSEILLKLKERIDMPFRNVTRIQFGASLTLTSS